MRALGLILIAAAAFLIIFYAVTVPVEMTYGERYVDAEIPFIFPFYVIASFKPITLIAYFLFGGIVLMLEAYRENLRRFNTRGLRILLVFIAFASAYEVLWNLLAWFTIWQRTGGSLDMLANTTHSHFLLPVNFNLRQRLCSLFSRHRSTPLGFLQISTCLIIVRPLKNPND